MDDLEKRIEDSLIKLGYKKKWDKTFERPDRAPWVAIDENGNQKLLVDVITHNLTYIHFSLTDGRTLIYDVSGCDKITLAPPAPNGTLVAWKGDEVVLLEPINS